MNSDPQFTASMLTDAIGVQHEAVALHAPVRIVCLVPSITELLCDLGLAPWLVGRTGFCIHPKAVVSDIPKIGGTKDVNIGKIRQLAPTHLIVNIDENEKPTVEELAQFIPHVIVTHPITPMDNLALFRLLGAIFNVLPKAQQLCSAFEANLQRVHRDADATPKNILYCIWKDPWMTVSHDTYIAHTLALRGWQHWQTKQVEQISKRYPIFEWDDTSLQEIDAVLLSTEPYSFTHVHVEQLQQTIQKPVILVDGEMLSWYGSRAIAGLAYLAALEI
jgi:ABC-type Fe3+-hydroxamate transport system substrate-binding protein